MAFDLSYRRFWSKVDVRGEAECWLWKAGTFTTGYGAFRFGRRTQHAPRVAWILTKGDLSDDACLLHSCDNPLCVNPAHLHVGSHGENMRDMAERRRAVSGDEHWTRRNPAEVLRGSGKTESKLTELHVKVILEYFMANAHHGVLNEIMALFPEVKISKAAISQVIQGKTWAHVPRPAGFVAVLEKWSCSRRTTHPKAAGKTPSSSLSETDIREILDYFMDHRNDGTPGLALRFSHLGVTRKALWKIISRRTWQKVIFPAYDAWLAGLMSAGTMEPEPP